MAWEQGICGLGIRSWWLGKKEFVVWEQEFVGWEQRMFNVGARNLLFGRKEFVGSPWPPEEEIVFPEEKILGPGTIPLFTAFLNETVTLPESPRFLTEVKPARSVFLALATALIA